MEIWLQSNRRFFVLALIAPALLAALVAALLAAAVVAAAATLAVVLGGVLLLLLLIVAVVGWVGSQPRLAFDGRRLCIHLRFGRPLCVPIEFVEGFLLGSVPVHLPGGGMQRAEVSTVVIRIAERATQWARVDVEPILGTWCNHYVTLRGTWCEPLNVELVCRLNERLGAAHAAYRNSSSATAQQRTT